MAKTKIVQKNAYMRLSKAKGQAILSELIPPSRRNHQKTIDSEMIP